MNQFKSFIILTLTTVGSAILILLVTGVASFAQADDRKFSFPHAAELTSQAKQIVWQEVNQHKIPNSMHQEMICLAENIYFEARAEGMDGKAAVANVTRNRVESEQFPNTYCGVVYQGPVRESWKTKKQKDLADSERVYYPIKNRCQFSWYCDGEKDMIWANYERTGKEIKLNADAWRASVDVAIWTLGYGSYTVNDNTTGATYYYAHNLVYPHWADDFEVTEVIGNHTFMSPN
jgi:spore germination cell wall hydrolase CwlJ-like protein